MFLYSQLKADGKLLVRPFSYQNGRFDLFYYTSEVIKNVDNVQVDALSRPLFESTSPEPGEEFNCSNFV